MDSKNPLWTRIGELTRQNKAFLTEHPGRIYCSINGEGFGHSSRAIALAKQFRKSEFLVGAYGYALDRVQAFDIPAVEITQEIQFFGEAGGFDVRKTILKNPTAPIQLTQNVQEELELIKVHQVSLVIADGRVAPVLAAEKLGLPCLVLTNQSAFYPFFSQDSALVKLFGKSFEWMLQFWLSSAEEILIPDFPPPHTICLPNLSPDYPVKKRTRFVGPLVAWTAEEVVPQPRPCGADKPWIVLSLGGHQYRQPLLDAVLSLAHHMPGWYFTLLTTLPCGTLPFNVERLGSISDCSGYFKAADVVITQAGHSTAMELLTLGRASIVVPDANQMEQENNARRLQELGVAITIPYTRLSVPYLREAAESLLGQSPLHQQAQAFGEEARQINGAQTAASVLREYAARLTVY
jgi:UDP-N-acetylglucosamine--N-acetylmuramyl-(pentapeptide) pyrophosphoryl-undecaprenol N-acetylglucosamine transferase